MTQSPPCRADDGPDVWTRASALLVAWRAGDSGSCDALVRLLTPILWQVVRAYGLQQASAEDVVQDVWLTLARDPGQVTQPEALGAWLLTSARRRAWRAAGQLRERPDAELTATPAARHLPHDESAESTALAELANRDLWHAVGQLSGRCQRLLRIVAFDDRPDYARISADLGMPVGSIGPTRRRCLERLRASLTEGGHR